MSYSSLKRAFLSIYIHLKMWKQSKRKKLYPVHREIDPQGVVQLIQQFHKPLLLYRPETEQTIQKGNTGRNNICYQLSI